MDDADLISSLRRLRKLTSTLDSIGYPVRELSQDEELKDLISEDLYERIVNVSQEIHSTLQNIERSKRYKGAVVRLCNIKMRGEDDG